MREVAVAAPRERPILMSAPMVRALVAGTKTQTRRAVKWRGLEPGLNLRFTGLEVHRSGSNWVLAAPTRTSWEYRSVPMSCPYGLPGDRLWVREAWARTYVAQAGAEWVVFREGDNRTDYGGPWKPGIHLFRKDARILLEITDVRVQRLQEITREDALAEGIVHLRDGGFGLPAGEFYHAADPRQSYFALWEHINGPGSVEANPHVWAVSFRRLEIANK